MYGIINSSIHDMIKQNFGDEKWQDVLRSSGVAEDSFLSMRSYDDSVTYELLGAAADVIGESLETCLEMFGKFWVLETATKHYGILLDSTGDSLIECLKNLNDLHDRITSTFLDYMPPHFSVEELEDNQYRICYSSKRTGLTPFVVGLLKGLAAKFDSQLQFGRQISLPADGGEKTIFEVFVH